MSAAPSGDLTTTDPVVAAAGDIACPPPATPRSTKCQQAATADLLASGNYAAVLPLGDNQYDCGSYSDYLAVYDPTWGQWKSRSHPVPGDDDYSGGSCTSPGANGYFKYFGNLATPLQPGCTASCGGYYSWDLGGWHLIALNSNCAEPGVGGCGATSPQAKWLVQDLTAHPSKCTLAYWHHPYWGNGSVVSRTKAFVRILHKHGVDVLLVGHSHLYTRYAPQTPDSKADAATGLREFIVGTGGRSHSTLKSPQLPNVQVANDKTFGILALTLHPTSYDWKFRPIAGSSFTDSGSTACH